MFSLLCCTTISDTGDRYDSEPRARSKFEPIGGSRYDEDAHGPLPVRAYQDGDDDEKNDEPKETDQDG